MKLGLQVQLCLHIEVLDAMTLSLYCCPQLSCVTRTLYVTYTYRLASERSMPWSIHRVQTYIKSPRPGMLHQPPASPANHHVAIHKLTTTTRFGCCWSDANIQDGRQQAKLRATCKIKIKASRSMILMCNIKTKMQFDGYIATLSFWPCSVSCALLMLKFFQHWTWNRLYTVFTQVL
jgi:hypothetical protein